MPTAEEVEFDAAGGRLAGTVSCPVGRGSVPGVVLIGGSGPSDRHNNGLFDRLRDHLVDSGVAVLAYDKRGVGRSTGDWSTATVRDLSVDAAAAVALLRRDPRVAPDSVGVLGHSEGGWVALRLAAVDHQIRHLVVNSCPAVSFVDAEIFALSSAGADLDEAAGFYRRLGAAARNRAGVEQGRQIVADHRHQSWYAAALGDFELDDDSWAQLRAWLDYSPASDLNRLTTPTLATFGEIDPLVPVADSIVEYQQTAAETTRHQQIAVFAGADHRIRTAGGRFATGYLDLLSAWCTGAPGCRPQDRSTRTEDAAVPHTAAAG